MEAFVHLDEELTISRASVVGVCVEEGKHTSVLNAKHEYYFLVCVLLLGGHTKDWKFSYNINVPEYKKVAREKAHAKKIELENLIWGALVNTNPTTKPSIS